MIYFKNWNLGRLNNSKFNIHNDHSSIKNILFPFVCCVFFAEFFDLFSLTFDIVFQVIKFIECWLKNYDEDYFDKTTAENVMKNFDWKKFNEKMIRYIKHGLNRRNYFESKEKSIKKNKCKSSGFEQVMRWRFTLVNRVGNYVKRENNWEEKRWVWLNDERKMIERMIPRKNLW